MGNLIIDGDIKQKLLPFVCSPGQTKQTFTFREGKTQGQDVLHSRISMCPWSYTKFMESDIGNKLIFNRDGKSVSYKDILNSVPAIQIREYLPDTALDQAINLVSDVASKISSIMNQPSASGGTGSQNNDTNASGIIDKLTNVMKFFGKYFTGQGDPNIVDDLNTFFDKMPYYSDSFNKKAVLQLPYTFYYALQSCQTTGLYELPGIREDRLLYSSDGKPGWSGNASGLRLIEELPGIGGAKAISKLLGSMIDGLFGNIAISWMPFWDSASGNAAKEPTVSIKFDLFNDTLESSMSNFLFVHSIIPANKWIQYAIFQHAPALYDIKLEGYNRLFACAADFKVTYQGVLRDPSDKWIKTLLSSHLNSEVNISLDNIKNNKLIKIPDIYHVELNFESIFPANFNNWLYNYANNDDIITKYQNADAHTASKMSDMVGTIIGNVVKGIKDNWK